MGVGAFSPLSTETRCRKCVLLMLQWRLSVPLDSDRIVAGSCMETCNGSHFPNAGTYLKDRNLLKLRSLGSCFPCPFGESGKENHQKSEDFLCFPNPYPKNLFGLFLTFRVISILQGYFGGPSEIPFKTSTKLTSLGLF